MKYHIEPVACSTMLALVLVLFLVYVPSYIHGTTTDEKSWVAELQDIWLVRLFLNLLGYASVFVPAGLLIRYLHNNNYNEKMGYGLIPKCIRICVFGLESEKPSIEEGSIKAAPPPVKERTFQQNCLLLTFLAVGLQASYLTWGILQERIMKHAYGSSKDDPGEKFKNSQFLVFMNRILALCVACVTLLLTSSPRHTAPLYKYSYSSFSNIMSSWFQYEALKYVSFPTQVLGKASKIIPVMLMGKIVSKKTYQYYEYITAALISVGVSMFLLSRDEESDKAHSSVTTSSGIILMVGYMAFDSFTSNWQGELFSAYKMNPIQMMAGVNLFSCLLTCTSLFEQGGFVESVSFMLRHSLFAFHVLLLSLCSATGQLFIFYTISNFGPVTFTIIMTVRQGLAILLSCIIYHHAVSPLGITGVLIVFGAIFLKIYLNQRMKAKRIASNSTVNSQKV
ncbi:adenosine 3'-phospho 5'-phosphosulfate transporter 1 isoform X2 [Lingula anatina]|uniref:Adenosine 3'-phospho 5'-phosphosulfate transporter 1 n=1 Tax=Lingula anatina TaxID=7574 RepID=A0A1S3K3S4_LINAN|nr:adenosine 3'-phospho 5'-phosphosulfate transporter 1 isoform X2 [Lingula anatina]|eukprot:XP_013417275.1 adenosine 3'-phospho 5'-phosphosulfate transporter 1 isoform X2 [Lingula anatina]